MLRAVLACVVCVVGLVAVADEISPKVKKVIELGEIRRAERLSELDGGIRVMKAQYEVLKTKLHSTDTNSLTQPTGRNTSHGENRKATENEIQKLKERVVVAINEIESVREQKYYSPNITLKAMRVGDVGIVVDSYGSQMTAKIAQIVDEESAIITVEAQSIWLTVDTTGLKVGKRFVMNMPFEVTGTTTHKSVGGGAKKMFVLEQFFFPPDEAFSNQVTKSRAEQLR